jgi:hypothetical protein
LPIASSSAAVIIGPQVNSMVLRGEKRDSMYLRTSWLAPARRRERGSCTGTGPGPAGSRCRLQCLGSFVTSIRDWGRRSADPLYQARSVDAHICKDTEAHCANSTV